MKRLVFASRGLKSVLIVAMLLLVTVTGLLSVKPLPLANACNACNFLLKWGSAGSANGQFGASSPSGVAVDSSGNVYVVDSGNNRVQKFTSTGTFITTWGTSGSSDGEFSSPTRVSVDSSGNVYVVDSGNNRVQKFTSTGTFITTWGTSGFGPGNFETPGGVAVDSSGNVYVVDSGNGRVEKFTSAGSFLLAWGCANAATTSCVSGNANGQFFNPSSVAADSSGNVYVTDFSNARVQKFTGAGVFVAKWSDQFSSPEDVAVGPFGNVYVTDVGNRCVDVFGDSVLASISLVAGWNLISLPLVPLSTSTVSVLSGLIAAGNLTIAWSYQGGKWLFWAPSGTPTLTSMADGFGYWLYITAPSKLLVFGYTVLPGSSPSAYSLSLGWNLVGFKPIYPSENETVGAYLVTIGGKYTIAGVYDNLNATWLAVTPDLQLAPGEALWLYMTATATLVPPI